MAELKFSVAISVYRGDHPQYFRRALDSITTEQTVKPAEIVLVVDGPVSAEIDAVIDDFASRYDIFQIIRLEQNKGLGNALRLAVEAGSYELIARMDSDDVAVSDRFEQQLKVFQSDSRIDIVGGDITEFIGEEEHVVATRAVPCSDADIKKYMKTRCALNHVSVMYKKSAVLRCGNYKDLFWNEDYYLWIRMLERGCVMANTGTVLVNVRTGTDMYKRRGGTAYFKSEKFLQDYMLRQKIISLPTYCINICARLIMQVLLPTSVRGWVFRTFARS